MSLHACSILGNHGAEQRMSHAGLPPSCCWGGSDSSQLPGAAPLTTSVPAPVQQAVPVMTLGLLLVFAVKNESCKFKEEKNGLN